MIVGIDPGHGGIDPGAVGPAGTHEADLTLAISLGLAKTFEALGYTVILTRWKDEAFALRDRTKMLNEAGCDLVLSIHINAFDNPEPDYLSAWICGRGGQAEKIAQSILPELAAATGWPDGGVRVANFYILRRTDAPAVLLELGFISNPGQEQALQESETRENLVEAIVRGVKHHYNSIY